MAIMPFKVSNFDTNRKPVCDFLLVINTNLHPISHHFQVTADHWSNLCFRQKVLTINLQPWNLASKNYKYHPIIWCKMHFNNLNCLGVDRECDRQTDIWTELVWAIMTDVNNINFNLTPIILSLYDVILSYCAFPGHVSLHATHSSSHN